MEHKVLAAAIAARKHYETLASVDIANDLSDKGKVVYEAIEHYYLTDGDAKSVDVDLLFSRLERKFPKHAEQFKVLLDGFDKISPENIIEDVLETKKASLRIQLSAAFASGTDDKIDDLLSRYNKYNKGELENGAKESEIVTAPDISSIIGRTSSSNRIKLLPTTLNTALDGGALPGHHIIVFGRPEVGKSLFVLNMTYGFLMQGLKTLYVGNEDPMPDLVKRLIWRISGMDKNAVESNQEEVEKIVQSKHYDKFTFAALTPGTLKEIDSIMEEHRPQVMIVDQLRNVSVKDNNRVTQLETVALGVRMLGKKYGTLIVSVVQAGDSADNKLYLGMGDVDFSNTGIPAQADLMIGIGMDSNYERSGMRMLSFPKNKISGVKDPIRVSFNPAITKVE
jgi:archaellum biogenesis ATPase FlaH